MASVGSQYFTQAVVDKSSIMPEAKAQVESHAGEKAAGRLFFELSSCSIKAGKISLSWLTRRLSAPSL